MYSPRRIGIGPSNFRSIVRGDPRLVESICGTSSGESSTM